MQLVTGARAVTFRWQYLLFSVIVICIGTIDDMYILQAVEIVALPEM